MIRNRYYFSVPGSTGPTGPAGTSLTTLNPTISNIIVRWGNLTGTSLNDSTVPLYSLNNSIGLGTCLQSDADGYTNIYIGNNSAPGLHTYENIMIRNNTGSQYLDSESGNILIGHNLDGIAEENNVICLGSTQTKFYARGIYDISGYNGDHQSVFIDSSGKLHTVLSGNSTPMRELYYENLVIDTRTLTINVPAQFSMPAGIYYNTQFDSVSNGKLKYTGLYSRYAQISATISCVGKWYKSIAKF
jgi:hypothetical protein